MIVSSIAASALLSAAAGSRVKTAGFKARAAVYSSVPAAG